MRVSEDVLSQEREVPADYNPALVPPLRGGKGVKQKK